MELKSAQNRNPKEITEAAKTARFYGFRPIILPTIKKRDIESVKSLDQSSCPAEKAALLRMYFEEKMMSLPQPSMFYYEKQFHKTRVKKKNPKLESAIVSIGSSKSVCECLSIETGISILNSIGYKNLSVKINSIGDKDSINEFQRNLAFFIRKNFNSFPSDLKQVARKDLFAILRKQKEEWQEFQTKCPKSIDFLSESSREHFKEVLEFLEIMDIPYEINHYLVGDPDIGSETIFSIKNEDGELAYGFRFNRMAKKIGLKKDLSCTILSLSTQLKKNLKRTKFNKNIKPQFYLVQFGPEAKLKSFLILNELHKAGVGVIHSIAKDKLSGQINTAETSEAQYIVLIGQKEALENSVIVRHVATHAQEIVPICELAARAKTLIKPNTKDRL